MDFVPARALADRGHHLPKSLEQIPDLRLLQLKPLQLLRQVGRPTHVAARSGVTRAAQILSHILEALVLEQLSHQRGARVLHILV
jgi:hypothetical protein